MLQTFLALILVHASPEIQGIKELRDEEIAAHGILDLGQSFSEANFKSCIPQESIPYPKVWPQELQDKVFAGEAMGDLMKCRPKRCAFNFLNSELETYQDLKSEEERQAKFIEFYANRVSGKTGIDEARSRMFIRGKDKAFSICSSPEMDRLLDSRPLKAEAYRLSHIRYNPRMRQTTRIVQGLFFKNKSEPGFCYAEAMTFSDHYDLDRVETWRLSGNILELQVRHRIDLLNTWFRRLNKGSLRKELDGLVRSQLNLAAECLKSK